MISGYDMLFCISMLNLTLLDFVMFCKFVLSNIYVKNGIFEACFRQTAKGKITAWDPRYLRRIKYVAFLGSFACEPQAWEAGGTAGREPGQPGCLGSFAWS